MIGLVRPAPPAPRQQQQPSSSWKLSRWYCWLSAVGAALAIVTAPHDSSTAGSSSSRMGVPPPDSGLLSGGAPEFLANNNNNNNNVCWWDPLSLFDSCNKAATTPTTSESSLSSHQQQQHRNNNALRWILPWHDQQQQQQQKLLWQKQQKQPQQHRRMLSAGWWWFCQKQLRRLCSWIDPQLWQAQTNNNDAGETRLTRLIDKVLTSTLRLLLIANWLMALTVLLHTAVADWFLGDLYNNNNNNNNTNNGATATATTPRMPDPWTTNNNMMNPSTSASATLSRERMGGFLVFKLLLISAVVAPDTVDLMILLSWYTLLSFLRSLAALGAQQLQQQQSLGSTVAAAGLTTTTTTTSLPPSPGVWKLLAFCLTLDLMAAALCVGLFHGAGTGMVLLLTGDCALLAVDCATHLVQHVQWHWEWQQSQQLQIWEDEQYRLLQTLQQQQRVVVEEEEEVKQEEEEEEESQESPSHVAGAFPTTATTRTSNDTRTTTTNHEEDLSRELDRRIEALEQHHLLRTSWLESTIFFLQLLSDFLTIAHFLHIWSLHGVQLSLIDGVLALHLHSSIQTASQKIMERRHMHKIARDMEGAFPDASPLDLRKAAAVGDVCCICLGTMSGSYYYYHHNNNYCVPTTTSPSSTTEPTAPSSSSTSPLLPVLGGGNSGARNNVKKVACGHLYHANCLREVIERARSMEAARCPLCRASILHGNNNNNNNTGLRADPGTTTEDAAAAPAGAGERALFRFSTEHLFPAWLPLPAFSFEVVRRPAHWVPGGDARANENNNDNAAVQQRQQQQQQQQQTLLRRLLLLAGVVQMTAEEERVALEQLMEMFPQYDRQDMRAALRQRGSPEAVAESILLGTWTPSNINNDNVAARVRR